MATVGPATSDPKNLERLLKAGADLVRLNLSHGSHDDHRQVLRHIRRLADSQGRFVPTVVDLMGPRYRLGEVSPHRRVLKRGDQVRLGREETGADLPVDDEEILQHLRPGERILIDNGLVELRVEARGRRQVTARVVAGGPVSTRKGINLPDSSLPFTISAKDRADLAFAVAEGVDYVAASYVGTGQDVEALRQALRKVGGDLPVVAKLERGRAVQHLEEIVAASDAVMVARGDLGVEVPLHQVPVLQKRILAAARRVGKPAIVATQMLESMMEHPRPTRAEASDVANAVFDGADALMLSGETAAGRHPIETVKTMARIIKEAEAYRGPSRRGGADPPQLLGPLGGSRGTAADRGGPSEIPDMVSAAAVYAATQLQARHIVAFSQGGFTARLIARHRPAVTILVFTADPQVARQIQLVWGVRPLLMESEVEHHDEVVEVVDRQLLAEGLARPGDRIVILMGDPIRERPLTNLMRVHRVRRGRR